MKMTPLKLSQIEHWGFDQVIPKPACSATETSYKIEISSEAKLDMILYKK